MELIDILLGHDRWTTDLLLDLSDGLSDEQLDCEMDIGHRTLRRTYGHMIHGMDFWANLLDGTPIDGHDVVEWSVAEAKARHAAAYDRFEAVARRVVAENRLDEIFIDHYGMDHKLGALITMVIHHNQYHRTEMLHFLHRLGVDNLPTDADPTEWEQETRNSRGS